MTKLPAGTYIVPGSVRIRGGGGDYSHCLNPLDLIVEVQESDGTWIPLRGVCGLTLTIEPGDLVRPLVSLEVREIDYTVPGENVKRTTEVLV